MSVATAGRAISVTFETEWETGIAERRGFFAPDARVRTLLRVLLSYPEVRYVLPDRISLEPTAGPTLIETIARFLERQRWLVKRVAIG